MGLIDRFIEQAKSNPKRIIYPEGTDERIVAAAVRVAELGVARPSVLGKPEELSAAADRAGVGLDEVGQIDPTASADLERYAETYSKRRSGISPSVAKRLVRRPLFFGAMMVAEGDADGMVAGVANATARVIEAGTLAIGLAAGFRWPSSFFIMVVPGHDDEDDRTLIFADAAVTIDPTAEQLANIAVAAGQNAKALLNMDPRVAMLSFSTKGSASHPRVDKVVEATRLAQEMAPDLAIDGELQADSALSERVARKKVGESPVAGKANVLVFPDLDAANIAYKLTQYLAGAQAYGPIMQGFAKPVNDMSRGATVDDLIGVTAITVVQAAATSA